MKKTFTLLLCCMGFFSLTAQTKQGVSATEMRSPFTAAYAPMELRATGISPVFTTAMSGYLTEGFESTTFPPAGWRVQNVAGPTYTWARSTAQAHLSAASAFIRFDAVAGGAQDWLILPRFQVAPTDSVVFWLRLAFKGYSPDSLCLKVSTTDSLASSFTTTLLKLMEGTNYPPNATTWYRYAVSLSGYAGQQVILGFKHFNGDGDGLYIDDVAVGTKPANEVAVASATLPANTGTGTAITPQATVINNGSASQTFSVTTTISPGGYTSTQTVTALAPAASSTLTFGPWTPAAPGTYTVKIYTQLSGDANYSNDTLTRTVNVLSSFVNSGWSSQNAIPGGRWATGATFAKPCISGTDTGFVYMISGADATFANTTQNAVYNITTGTWRNKAPIPAARTQVTPLTVKNKIYVIGGYGGSFSPVTTNSIYDIITDTWTTGAPLPAAVGDYASGIYNDSLIYIIGGYNGSGDVNTVQVYNVNTNTWATATAKTGTAVGGGRAAITGNKIVHVGGYSQTLASSVAESVMGMIDPANPLVITWTALPNYPGGTTGRHGAGVLPQANGLVYFAAGDPDGQGTSALNTVYAYNTNLSQWETGPAMIAGVSNINSIAGVIKQDTLFLVVVGGYNGSSVITTNQWLKIGPATVPAVSANTAICDGGSTTLTASNGTAYSWTPAATLSNATIAAPTATPTATTTYTVNISQKYGCPVPKTVTVTVNPLPVADAGTSTAICSGNSTMLNATGGVSYSWAPSTGLTVTNTATPTAIPAATTTYTVMVTDANGCVNSDNVTVTVNPLPVANAGPGATICNGDNVVLSGSGGGSYSWSPATGLDMTNVSGPTASPSLTTTYTLTVTDANGCTDENPVTVTVNALPLADAGTSTGVCEGDTVMIGSADAGYTYSWTPATGLSSPSIANPDANPAATTTYTLTVTDANACVNTDVITLTVNELPMTLIGSSNISCNGLTDGSAGVSVSGSSTYSYLWSTMATTSSISGLAAGGYSVVITDDSTGCVVNASVGISEPDAIVLTTMDDTTNICDGSVMVSVTGGVFSYNYLWSPSGETTDTPTNLCPGTYTVTVTDSNGCTETATANVLSTVSVTEEVANALMMYPNPAKDNLVISGMLSGTTSVVLMDVTGKTVMTIADNATGNYNATVDISTLSPGVYFLQLKNESAVSTRRIIKQ